MRPKAGIDYAYRDIKPDDTLVFLGEIERMPGHGVWASLRNSKLHVGLHIDQFEDVPKEDL